MTSHSPAPPALLQDKQPFRQWKSWTVPNTHWTIVGYSRSNDKTFFHIPQLQCALDAGICEGRRPRAVFLTHTHNDHTADLEFLAGNPTGVTIYAPSIAVPFINTYIQAKRELNHLAPFDPTKMNPYLLQGVEGGDTFVFGKNDNIQVRVVECVHQIPCVGYGFSEKVRLLLPEYLALKEELLGQGKDKEFGQKMASLRQQGIETHKDVWEPRFVFLGDTHASVFEQQPWVLDYPVVLTECTFLHDTEKERAASNGHTVWSELLPTVKASPDTLFVLTHFSLRHSDAEVVRFFQEQTHNLSLQNVMVWAHEESLLPEQHQTNRS